MYALYDEGKSWTYTFVVIEIQFARRCPHVQNTNADFLIINCSLHCILPQRCETQVWHQYYVSGHYPSSCLYLRSRDSVVGIATGYGLDDRRLGVRVPVQSRMFSSSRRPDRLWGPPNLLSNGYRGFFPRGVRAARREADHSPPASAEVKKMWIYTSILPYAFVL
jgi:hypothetical protein